jgi:hypothetical protein
VAGAAKVGRGQSMARESVGPAQDWKGAKAVGRWVWDVLKSGAALAWSYVVNTPGASGGSSSIWGAALQASHPRCGKA